MSPWRATSSSRLGSPGSGKRIDEYIMGYAGHVLNNLTRRPAIKLSAFTKSLDLQMQAYKFCQRTLEEHSLSIDSTLDARFKTPRLDPIGPLSEACAIFHGWSGKSTSCSLMVSIAISEFIPPKKERAVLKTTAHSKKLGINLFRKIIPRRKRVGNPRFVAVPGHQEYLLWKSCLSR